MRFYKDPYQIPMLNKYSKLHKQSNKFDNLNDFNIPQIADMYNHKNNLIAHCLMPCNIHNQFFFAASNKKYLLNYLSS